jgi:hypothetical protein
MKESPILFSGQMVQAILDGRKTQTRRAVTSVRGFGQVTEFQRSDTKGYDWTFRNSRMLWNDLQHNEMMAACPYGVVGDRLWVRETWAFEKNAIGAVCDEDGPFVYAADGSAALQHRLEDKWTPSIHMPRYASRIDLEVIAVRVERLQDISEADALAEGIAKPLGSQFFYAESRPKHLFDRGSALPGMTPQGAYRNLWEHLNGARSWDANPWVWVIEFQRMKP